AASRSSVPPVARVRKRSSRSATSSSARSSASGRIDGWSGRTGPRPPARPTAIASSATRSTAIAASQPARSRTPSPRRSRRRSLRGGGSLLWLGDGDDRGVAPGGEQRLPVRLETLVGRQPLGAGDVAADRGALLHVLDHLDEVVEHQEVTVVQLLLVVRRRGVADLLEGGAVVEHLPRGIAQGGSGHPLGVCLWARGDVLARRPAPRGHLPALVAAREAVQHVLDRLSQRLVGEERTPPFLFAAGHRLVRAELLDVDAAPG